MDAIHVTGSEATYSAIAAENATGKPIASELGNVSPAIILPGEWSERALRFHAEQLASAKLHNDGFNCIALQVLVLPGGWRQREAFIAQLRRAFAAAADRVAYYPASRERCAGLVAGRAGAVTFGGAGGERIARTIVFADPNDVEEPLFSREVFGPLLAIVSFEAGDAESYLRAAVDFCNERLRGDLCGDTDRRSPNAAKQRPRDRRRARRAAIRLPWGQYLERRRLCTAGGSLGRVSSTRGRDQPERARGRP